MRQKRPVPFVSNGGFYGSKKNLCKKERWI